MSRRFAIWLTLILAGSPLGARAQQPTAAPALVVEEAAHEFGEAWEGEPLRHVFTFRNAGGAPLLAKGG